MTWSCRFAFGKLDLALLEDLLEAGSCVNVHPSFVDDIDLGTDFQVFLRIFYLLGSGIDFIF